MSQQSYEPIPYGQWLKANRERLRRDYYLLCIDEEIQTFEEYCENQWRYSN